MRKGAYERHYSSTAGEFRLSFISTGEGDVYEEPGDRSVKILFCTEGEASIREINGGGPLVLSRGSSVLIPATVRGFLVEGKATVYKAAVPDG
jgi:mannose-6-phosphate isomerase class I